MPSRYSVACILLLLAGASAAENWPGWRGPTGLGQTSAKDLPLTWGGKDNENVLWKVPLIEGQDSARRDQNQSSPIVWGERVFVTFSYWPETVAASEFPEHHVVCFRTTDGKRLWDTRVPPGPWLLKDLRGGYSAPTPATDGERVYVLFGSSVLAALDLDGKLLWKKDITPHAFDVAIGTSPVVYRDTVLVMCELTTKASRLLAFDRKTGEVKWEAQRPTADWTHSTPVVATIKGKPQLLVAGAFAMQGLDPDSGKVLWSCALGDKPAPRVGDTPSVVVAGDLAYVDSGRGGPGLAVDPTGEGDVSKTHLKWQLPLVPGGSFSSAVIVGEYLYRLQTPGVLRCVKRATGEAVYTERLEGVSVAPSPIATPEGRIYFAGAGKSFVVQAGPKFEVLATNQLGDPSQTSPAVSGGRIYLKGGRFLFCIGKK